MNTKTSLCLIPALLLSLSLSGCSGGDGGGGPIRPQDLRLSIVRGNGQRAPVAGAAASAARLSVSGQSDPDVLPTPLVARIVISGPSASRSTAAGDITGPAFQELPAGTLVDWEARPEGCGRGFVTTTAPDDSAYVVNRWRKGTRAGTCWMFAQLLVNGEPVTADSFAATFDPGPYEGGYGFERIVTADPAVVPEEVLRDRHGNAIPFRLVVPEGDTLLVVGGAGVGTVEARTIAWNKAKVIAAGGNPIFVMLDIVTATGEIPAHLQIRLIPAFAEIEYQLVR